MINKLFILFCFLSLTCLSCGQKKSHPSGLYFEHTLDTLLENMHARNQFDGTLLIGNKEGIMYTKALGTANRSHDIPMSENHRFDIASLNKSFIAALILLAEEQQKLRTGHSVSRYLPDFSYPGADTITIHQLLTHSSGIPDYPAIPDDLKDHHFRKFKRLHFTNEEYVTFISGLPPVARPGEKFYYSNFGYHLLAIILERVWKKPFSKILEEQICNPLQLRHTYSPSSNEEVYPDLAEGYNYHPERKIFTKNQFIDFSLGRRIYATVGDLYLWGKALSDTTFLSPPSFRKMNTNHLLNLAPAQSYGYGMVVHDGGNYKLGKISFRGRYLIHGGATEGYKSMLTVTEGGKWIVTHLSNIGDRTNEIMLTDKIFQILTNPDHEN